MSQDITSLNAVIPLRAGPLDLCFAEGGLRHLRLGGREVLRRVYVALRNQYWETIPGELDDLKLESDDETFVIRFLMRHQRDEIDFRWRGGITGDRRGTVTFTMDGEAHSTFLRNRIGFCVLHPINECAGQPCTVEHVTGEITHSSFPQMIAPHQPFFDIRAITHEVLPGTRATVRFEGGTFEMEDQRNWTDASFKTYCTPLARPFPVELERGTKIWQRVTLTLDNVPAIRLSNSVALTLRVSSSPLTKLPRLGVGAASHRQPLDQSALRRLGALHLAHLRVDLNLAEDCESELQRVTAEAQALNVSLEAAIFLSDAADDELKRLRALVERYNAPVTWLVFHLNEKVTQDAHLKLARKHLLSVTPMAKFGGGTNLYFTEINRERPPLDALDLVCYSINPQVHAVDDLSLIENLAAQAETVRSARHFAGALPIALTPVTLKPRFNLHKGLHGFDQADVSDTLPASVDARQPTLFAAAWTLGSLKYLAESGASSVTYYETTGWRGVMERTDGSSLPNTFHSLLGAVFPLYHVLADVGELAGGAVLPVESSDPLKVIGLAIRRQDVACLMLANLSPEAQSVMIEGISKAHSIRRLNQGNLEAAMQTPASFRARRLAPPRLAEGRLCLELSPYEVVCAFY